MQLSKWFIVKPTYVRALILLTALSALLALVYGSVWSAPAVAGARAPVPLVNRALATCAPQTAGTAPFVDIIPSLDGAELLVRVVGAGNVGKTTFAEVDIGPTGHMLSWTDTLSEHIATAVVPGLTPGVNILGSISITTTYNPQPETLQFYRAYVPRPNNQTIRSANAKVELTLVSTDTLTTDSYILVMPSLRPPGLLPADHCLIGATYNVRAAGALPTANRPLSLRLYFDEFSVAGLARQSLAIFAWNETTQSWDNLGGQLLSNQNYLALVTARFTTYALVAMPSWRDSFNNGDGLDFVNGTTNVTLSESAEDPMLILTSQAITGVAVSQLITPTFVNATWDKLTYTAITNPPTTTLTVDVISATGGVLRHDLPSGASLADLDSTQFPNLRVRAHFSSIIAGQTPALDDWQVSWRSRTYEIYLPLIIGQE
jgi:microcystin-dependent protein